MNLGHKPNPKKRNKLSLEQQACNIKGELADCVIPRQALDLLPLLNLIPRKLWTTYPKPHGCLVVLHAHTLLYQKSNC